MCCCGKDVLSLLIVFCYLEMMWCNLLDNVWLSRLHEYDRGNQRLYSDSGTFLSGYRLLLDAIVKAYCHVCKDCCDSNCLV